MRCPVTSRCVTVVSAGRTSTTSRVHARRGDAAAAAARACLRIYRRPDNTVITSDCRARLRAARKRGLLVFAGALLVVLWAQICAQFVGMMGLKRLLVAGGATMGAPVPVAMPRPNRRVIRWRRRRAADADAWASRAALPPSTPPTHRTLGKPRPDHGPSVREGRRPVPGTMQ